jgi:phosphohistidine phosphatase
MSRQLLVLRHAKSAWNTDAPTDLDRPLAKRGKKAARRVGLWLRDQGFVPDRVLSSPAVRAQQTVMRVRESIPVENHQVLWEPKIYDAQHQALLQVLKDLSSGARTIMLVGHNPALVDLLHYLYGSDIPLPADGKLLTTAAVARLSISDQWSGLRPGSATSLSITRPRDM